MIHDFSDFSDRHPALLASFFFLIGLGLAKGYALELSLPLLLVSAPLAKKAFSKLLPLFVFLIIAFFYGLYKAPHFPSSQNEFTGKALFIPSEIKTHRSHFKKTLWLKGSIRYMVTQEGSVLKNIPCLINLSKDHPKIDSHFYLEGVLQKADHSFFFTPEKSSPWTAAPHTFSLAEIRFQAKKILSKQIGSLFTDPKIFRFLTALCLGDLDDRMLSFDFARLGLQHILAISGFHFGLLAFFLHALFRFFLPEKWVYLLLLLGLTAYFLLLGSSPSILRAYLALGLYIAAKLGGLPTNPLNILGVVLLLELLLEPMNLSNLGFQLSFLATFAILFLMPTTTSWMHKLFPVRSLKTTLQMPFLDRWMYLVCCLLRSAFALNLAVHLVIVPVCLFYFQKFPVLGLLYNLFIPFLISLGLSAFFLSILLLWIFPPLGKLFLSGLELFMSEVLALICQSPLCLDLSLRLKLFPLFFLVMVLCLVFSLPFRKLILLKLLPSQETKNPLRL